MCRLSEKRTNENGKSAVNVGGAGDRCKIIAISNQKGGVGKTTTCVNLGIGLARAGEKVLLVEADAQGSLAVSLGISEPDKLDVTLVNILEKVINDEETWPGEGIIRHEEGTGDCACEYYEPGDGDAPVPEGNAATVRLYSD